MRTVLFFGLLYIGDSINQKQQHSKELLGLYLIIAISAIVMDIVDFLR